MTAWLASDGQRPDPGLSGSGNPVFYGKVPAEESKSLHIKKVLTIHPFPHPRCLPRRPTIHIPLQRNGPSPTSERRVKHFSWGVESNKVGDETNVLPGENDTTWTFD